MAQETQSSNQSSQSQSHAVDFGRVRFRYDANMSALDEVWYGSDYLRRLQFIDQVRLWVM